jgi:hypothetical protein
LGDISKYRAVAIAEVRFVYTAYHHIIAKYKPSLRYKKVEVVGGYVR